jgi:hypothetical protein
MTRSQRAGSFTVAMAILMSGCSSLPPAAHRLRTFHDMAELETYRERVRTLAERQNVLGSRHLPKPNMRILLAQNDAAPCDPAIADCNVELEQVLLTGSRKSAPQSITNNQEVDVDEGDIVKQYGRFLIVLKDGRLFSIDTGAPGTSLRLADRIDIYSSPEDETWYDELLIHDDWLIVTGYNYGEDASEIDLIAIDAGGGLELRARYYIESNDYYSVRNYASRLAHGQFVVYTPIDLRDDEPLAIPRIRSWTPGGGLSEWRPLFDITDVYRPIQQTLTPSLHVVSVCRFDRPEKFACRSRGVVGAAYSQMYVASENIYLWLSSDLNDWIYGRDWPDECAENVDPSTLQPLTAAVFQIPIAGGGVRALHTIGVPNDQFAFDERDGRLLALLKREPVGCYLYEQQAVPLIYESIPLALFRSAPIALDSDAIVRVPALPGWGLQNRYSRDYLLYGAPQDSWWEDISTPAPRQLVVVPLANPAGYEVLAPAHTVQRIELIGDNAVAFGFAESVDDEENLGISTVELRAQPHLADTRVLPDIQESEGRSHAFNALIGDDGSGILGLPTVYASKANWYWSNPSDVQFFSTDATLTLAPLGELAGTGDTDKSYECQVSCYDWYGNARPIFIAGRVFALSGSELIEGEIRAGSIVEIGRVRMTAGQDPRPSPAHTLSSRIRIRERVEPVAPPPQPQPVSDEEIPVIWPVR